MPLVFLEGSPTYYARFGFRPALEQGFRKPSLRIPDAGFQVFLLPAYEPWMTGTLVYSEPSGGTTSSGSATEMPDARQRPDSCRWLSERLHT